MNHPHPTPPNHHPPAEREGMRLSKAVMALAGCSRAQAERLIQAGRVRVDGHIVRDIPSRIQSHQHVHIDQPETPPPPTRPSTLLLHQPAGTPASELVQLLDPAHRWARDRGPHPQPSARLRNLCPLEPSASGLLVFSQNTGLARQLQTEGQRIEHELMADVRGPVPSATLERLRQLSLPPPARADRSPQLLHVSISHSRDGITRLRMSVAGYQPGWAARLCAQVGLELLALKRQRIGRIALKDLPEGQWRSLLPVERF